MSRRSAVPSARSRRGWWLVIPAVVLALTLWDAVVRSRHILELSASYDVAVEAPAVDAKSPTGYAHGLRSMLVPLASEDTAHWVMQTQEMIARGDWRLRHVDYDNAPAGRAVHWAAPFHWWLGFLAWADHFATGRPIGMAVEDATLVSGTAMLALLLAGLTPLLNGKFSGAAAALFALGAICTPAFYHDFLPGRADHHGLATICGLSMVLFMVVGSGDPQVSGTVAANWERSQRRRRWTPRHWFVASAVAGGLGLWISAATIVPVLLGLGCGIVVASWFGRFSAKVISWVASPELFRIWGWTGGGVSLVAYLIEYFPSHLGLRLEVNHPLYAVAWAGGGECLRLVVIAVAGGRAWSKRDWATAGLAAGAVGLLPVILFFTAARSFTVADPFIWELHTRYIAEFQSLLRSWTTKGSNWDFAATFLPIFVLLPAVALVLRRSTPAELRAQLLLALCPAAAGWIQGFNQVRWLGLAYGLSVPAIALCFRSLEGSAEKLARTRTIWFFAGTALFVPGLVNAFREAHAGAKFANNEIRHLAERDVAHWLRQRSGSAPVTVASAPTSTTLLISQGGFAGLDTLYWENREGLKQAAALFATSSVGTAQATIRRLGVTHIVFFSWDPFAFTLAELFRGLPPGSPALTDTFIAKLLAADVPPAWLRELPFPLPDHPAFSGEQIRIWEVVPEQTPAAAAAHAASYAMELEKREPALRLAASLARFGDELAPAVMLAGIEARQQDAAGFSTAMNRILALLPEAGALALDDHVQLVVALAVADRLELAREQLVACVRKIDEASLRRLSPGTLSDLLALSEGLRVDLPDPALKRLAQQLVPPMRRK